MEYTGYEVGRIRPPSESQSLLVRLTRNCPWNHCKFCSLYKGEKFSIRPKEHVLKDIDLIAKCIDTFKKIDNGRLGSGKDELERLKIEIGEENMWGYQSALSWYGCGMESIFLQDANSMIIKPKDMIDILEYIREKFPTVKRITTYARSHTISRIAEQDLIDIGKAGLNRIHIGMESACDDVLKLIKKGVNKEEHILAGQKVMKAGIELSEYFMPGLGGKEFSIENALETADALNKINPSYIRIRTLAVTERSELIEDYKKGVFTRTNDTDMAKELLIFIKALDGIDSVLKSDHILNLIPEVEGKLPVDKEKMINALQWYLDLDEEEKIVYRIGRRVGSFFSIHDYDNLNKRKRVLDIIKKNRITKENVDAITEQLINRFI